MAVTSAAHHVRSDTTFRGYSSSQAEEYARRRGGYPAQLINEILKLHAATGGAFGTLLDLGCGPGNATRDLAAHFDHAIGMDPSEEMVRAATAVGGQARLGPIIFRQGDAEECLGVPDQSVDLIVAATSAHWFDMERFWPTAARVLKPGGTVAFFTIWRIFVHPTKTPHAEECPTDPARAGARHAGPVSETWQLVSHGSVPRSEDAVGSPNPL